MPKRPTTTAFADLLCQLAEQYPSRLAFARAINVDPSRLSRAMNGDPVMFDALRCLQVAKQTKADPSVVLRAAGKGELADAIEELYGKPRDPNDRVLLAAFERLGPEMSGRLLSVAEDLHRVSPPPPARTKSRRSA